MAQLMPLSRIIIITHQVVRDQRSNLLTSLVLPVFRSIVEKCSRIFLILTLYLLTWESFRPSFSASFLRSGLLMYFCIWNLFSRPRLWRSEKTALLIIPRRGFPRAFVAHGNTKPVPVKSPSPPWIAPGNAVPPPGAPGWWPPVPEPATVD